MKNKSIYSVCITAAAFIILNATSCRENIPQNSQKETTSGDYTITSETSAASSKTSAETSDTADTTTLPVNAITSIVRVTDKNGITVTDADGIDVTEIVISENKITEQTKKPIDETQTQKPQTDAPSAEPEHRDPVLQTLKMTWLCDSKDATLPVGAGQLAAVTFKIKEDAPDGDYNIELLHGDDSDTGSFVKYDSKKKYSNLDGGIISVGSGSAYDDNPSPDDYDTYANLSNACANRGETVTLNLNAENIHAGIGAFTLKIRFDSSVMELTDISQGSVFDSISKGTFMTNPSMNQ
ncbi:MAG: cohesin domain-containing protein [Oscillospiraceae bacterium]|nr:cohesin domain-containing protein [Oscillospiraceae bacterium]